MLGVSELGTQIRVLTENRYCESCGSDYGFFVPSILSLPTTRMKMSIPRAKDVRLIDIETVMSRLSRCHDS